MHFTVFVPINSFVFLFALGSYHSLWSQREAFIFHSMLKATIAVKCYCTPNAECQMHLKQTNVTKTLSSLFRFISLSSLENFIICSYILFVVINPHLKNHHWNSFNRRRIQSSIYIFVEKHSTMVNELYWIHHQNHRKLNNRHDTKSPEYPSLSKHPMFRVYWLIPIHLICANVLCYL